MSPRRPRGPLYESPLIPVSWSQGEAGTSPPYQVNEPCRETFRSRCCQPERPRAGDCHLVEARIVDYPERVARLHLHPRGYQRTDVAHEEREPGISAQGYCRDSAADTGTPPRPARRRSLPPEQGSRCPWGGRRPPRWSRAPTSAVRRDRPRESRRGRARSPGPRAPAHLVPWPPRRQAVRCGAPSCRAWRSAPAPPANVHYAWVSLLQRVGPASWPGGSRASRLARLDAGRLCTSWRRASARSVPVLELS